MDHSKPAKPAKSLETKGVGASVSQADQVVETFFETRDSDVQATLKAETADVGTLTTGKKPRLTVEAGTQEAQAHVEAGTSPEQDPPQSFCEALRRDLAEWYPGFEM